MGNPWSDDWDDRPDPSEYEDLDDWQRFTRTPIGQMLLEGLSPPARAFVLDEDSEPF